MMNKGLEVIEAHWLFGAPPEAIEVVIHPQSVIHSLVEYVDGLGARAARPSRHAHADRAGARLPGPHRCGRGIRSTSRGMAALTFEAPDPARFPCLALAYDALAAPAARRRPCSMPRTKWRSPPFSRGASASRTSPPHARRRSRALPARTVALARRRARRRRRGAPLAREWLQLPVESLRERSMMDILQKIARFPRRAGRAGRLSRARPLPGRAPVRRQGAAVLGRIRPRRLVAPVWSRTAPSGRCRRSRSAAT